MKSDGQIIRKSNNNYMMIDYLNNDNTLTLSEAECNINKME